MVFKIVDNWSVLSIYNNNGKKYMIYNQPKFKWQLLNAQLTKRKKMIKHNRWIIRNIDLKVYQYKKLIRHIRKVNYYVKIEKYSNKTIAKVNLIYKH